MAEPVVGIFEANQQEATFYGMMGQYFAHRKYAAEMGGWQFYNEDNSTWFVLLVDGEVAGFCSEFVRSTHVFWDNFYILERYRGQGFSGVLSKARLEHSLKHGKEIRTITDNQRQMNNYAKMGLQSYGKKGRYTKFKLEVSNETATTAAA